MEQRIIATVSQLNNFVKRTFEANQVYSDIWIKGEISNLKKHFSGHIYLTLKDEGGVLKAVMFKSYTGNLNISLSDGMKVLAHGRVSVYEAGGVYQLYIDQIVPDGVGELYIAYEKLKKRLEEEGLFDEKYKKPIPQYPEKIGVVTASTGAAVRDIINVLTRRYPYAKIILYPAKVQGTDSAKSIASGIEYFNKTNTCDTIIIGRGGGSIEDLWAFNEEIVAYAVFKSNIPIISAVGHEVDFTISDFVADLRAPTPSAAAEIAVPSTEELYSKIENYTNILTTQLQNTIKNYKLHLKALKLLSPKDVIDNSRIKIDNFSKNIETLTKSMLRLNREALSSKIEKLDALSPLKVMLRGYAIPQSEDGSVIKSVKTLDKTKEFDLMLSDGKRHCQVILRKE